MESLLQLKSYRSLEQDNLLGISESLVRFDYIRKELELEVQQLTKKNLILQLEIMNKDDIIEKFQTAQSHFQTNNFNGRYSNKQI